MLLILVSDVTFGLAIALASWILEFIFLTLAPPFEFETLVLMNVDLAFVLADVLV